MRRSVSLGLIAIAASLAACAPTMRKAGDAWHPEGAIYSLASAKDGRVMPEGWTLANYSKTGDHLEKTEVNDARDLIAKRSADDGVLIVDTEELNGDTSNKKLDVIAERWLQRVVVAPAEEASARYDELLPPLVTTTKASLFTPNGPALGEVETRHGRSASPLSHDDIVLTNGSGYEVTSDLTPLGGAAPDRRLYLAILRPSHGWRIVVVAYANTPAMFEAGAEDAKGVARRVRF